MIRPDRMSEQRLLAVTPVDNEAQLRAWNEVRNAGDPHDATPFEVLLDLWKRPGTRTHVLGTDEYGSPKAACTAPGGRTATQLPS